MAVTTFMEAPEQDHYAILNIAFDCTLKQIKKAFRKLIMTYHPDRNVAKICAVDADEMSKKINTAHDVLADEEARAEYDCRYESVVMAHKRYAEWLEDPLRTTEPTARNMQATAEDVEDDGEENHHDSGPSETFTTGTEEKEEPKASGRETCIKVSYSYMRCGHAETNGLAHTFHACGNGPKKCYELVAEDEVLNGFCPKCLVTNPKFKTGAMKAHLKR